MPYKRILFPVDFSSQCEQFGGYVAAVARRFGAEVTLLHVVDSAPLAYYGMDPAMSMAAAYAEAMAERRKQAIQTFLREELAGLAVQRITEPGEAAAAIAGYVLSAGIDLIMTTTHGYGRFRRFLLGSVTAKVLHDAECDVWTAAHVEHAPRPSTPAFHNVLCAVDLSDESVPLLRSAARVTAELGSSLRLAHAMPLFEGSSERLYDSVRSALDQAQIEAGTSAEICLEAGDVAHVVHSAAVRHDASLVVIGRGRISQPLGNLRTHTYAIVRESPCPVLSVYLGPKRERVSEAEAIRPVSLAVA